MIEPTIPKDIVEFLEETFPMRDYSPNDDIRQIDYQSGQRSVVNYIRAKYQEQNENLLDKKVKY